MKHIIVTLSIINVNIIGIKGCAGNFKQKIAETPSQVEDVLKTAAYVNIMVERQTNVLTQCIA